MLSQPGFQDSGVRVGCLDPNGLSVRVQVSVKRELDLPCAKTNTWSERGRVNQPAPAYDRATPVEVGHVVFFVLDLNAATVFYQDVLGFQVSDRYPGRGHFMRLRPRGRAPRHVLAATAHAQGWVNHVAFTVRDLHEVVGGGMHMSRKGWATHGPWPPPDFVCLVLVLQQPRPVPWPSTTPTKTNSLPTGSRETSRPGLPCLPNGRSRVASTVTPAAKKTQQPPLANS